MKIHTLFLSSVIAFSTANALTIQLDFSQDTSTFFTDNAAAKAAVQAAANDLGKMISTQLTAISGTNNADGNNVNAIKGTTPTGTITLDWSERHSNPTTGVTGQNDTPEIAANTFKIFVGAQSLSGSVLGQGGPGGASVGGSLRGSPDYAAAAVINNAYMNRGGPNLGSISLGTNGSFGTYQYGYMTGNLWFDNDTSTTWHYDHTTAVAAGAIDLYSTALHEMTHAIGFGIGPTWEANQKDSNGTVSSAGTIWSGANGVAANGGSGNDLVTDGHVASGIKTAALAGSSASNITAGADQEALMSPSIASGRRKYFTAMDIAFLKDMGWAIVPEPSVVVLIGAGALIGATRRRRQA